MRASSSVVVALASHARGQAFNPPVVQMVFDSRTVYFVIFSHSLQLPPIIVYFSRSFHFQFFFWYRIFTDLFRFLVCRSKPRVSLFSLFGTSCQQRRLGHRLDMNYAYIISLIPPRNLCHSAFRHAV